MDFPQITNTLVCMDHNLNGAGINKIKKIISCKQSYKVKLSP